MTEKLDIGDTNARKSYIRSIVETIEVDDNAIRIIGSKDVLQAVIACPYRKLKRGNIGDVVRRERG